MYVTDFYIDSVQNAKKQFVETFITDETIQTKMIAAIDAQTQFAKTVVAGTYSMAEIIAKNFTAFSVK